jgi:hypothetical protein
MRGLELMTRAARTACLIIEMMRCGAVRVNEMEFRMWRARERISPRSFEGAIDLIFPVCAVSTGLKAMID